MHTHTHAHTQGTNSREKKSEVKVVALGARFFEHVRPFSIEDIDRVTPTTNMLRVGVGVVLVFVVPSICLVVCVHHVYIPKQTHIHTHTHTHAHL